MSLGVVRLSLALVLATLAGCERPEEPAIPALAQSASDLAAAPRISGGLPPPASPAPQVMYGAASPALTPGRVMATPTGSFSLDFADTDIREVVAQILGTLLGRTYTIDPAVHGSVTLHTGQPVPAEQLLPTLEMLLANTGSVLVASEGVYRVVPAATAGAAGSVVISLRYVSADELAKVLQPVAGANAKVTAETGLNALLISADPPQIEAVRETGAKFRHRRAGAPILRAAAGQCRQRPRFRRRDGAGISRQGRIGARRAGARGADGPAERGADHLFAAALHRCGPRGVRADRPRTAQHGAQLARVLPAEQQTPTTSPIRCRWRSHRTM